jgi:Arc/MetJ family transcription regulator
MRTNIELNDDLVAEARKYSKAKSKRALVEEALAAFITVKAEERRRRTYKERLEGLRHKITSIRLRSDSRDIIRKDRDLR